jgi:hypothetical protein
MRTTKPSDTHIGKPRRLKRMITGVVLAAGAAAIPDHRRQRSIRKRRHYHRLSAVQRLHPSKPH